MVQVVKGSLSAFYAGRKGLVAKRPYKPILGEIFQHHWTSANDTEEDAEKVLDTVAPNSVTHSWLSVFSSIHPFQPFMPSILIRRYNSAFLFGQIKISWVVD